MSKELEWTGERFIPGVGAEIAYEHYGRYEFALQFCRGKVVLDAPAGEGFGSARLSTVAREVVGVDLSEQAVSHAREMYKSEHLSFRVDDIAVLSGLENETFDVITCFEGIEHLSAQEQPLVLRRFTEILKPDGVLLISTPNKTLYSDLPQHKNEFHQKEFYFDEYAKFLKGEFKQVHFFGQSSVDCAVITQVDQHAVNDICFYNSSAHAVNQSAPSPEAFLFFVAVCHKDEAVQTPEHGMTLVDLKNTATQLKIRKYEAEIERLKRELVLARQSGFRTFVRELFN